jgi:hypothetical protein
MQNALQHAYNQALCTAATKLPIAANTLPAAALRPCSKAILPQVLRNRTLLAGVIMHKCNPLLHASNKENAVQQWTNRTTVGGMPH